MLQVNQLIGFGVGGIALGPPPVLAFETNVQAGADNTTYTFAAVDIGTAAADRRVIVAITANSNAGAGAAISSATIGGITADIIVEHMAVSASSSHIFMAEVPTGTTADIVVTFAAAQIRAGIGVWSVTGLTNPIPTDTVSTATSPAVLDLDVLEGGFIIGVAYAASDPEMTWAGGTERYEANIEGSTDHSGADNSNMTAATPHTFTCTYTGETAPTACSASFR